MATWPGDGGRVCLTVTEASVASPLCAQRRGGASRGQPEFWVRDLGFRVQKIRNRTREHVIKYSVMSQRLFIADTWALKGLLHHDCGSSTYYTGTWTLWDIDYPASHLSLGKGSHGNPIRPIRDFYELFGPIRAYWVALAPLP